MFIGYTYCTRLRTGLRSGVHLTREGAAAELLLAHPHLHYVETVETVLTGGVWVTLPQPPVTIHRKQPEAHHG